MPRCLIGLTCVSTTSERKNAIIGPTPSNLPVDEVKVLMKQNALQGIMLANCCVRRLS